MRRRVHKQSNRDCEGWWCKVTKEEKDAIFNGFDGMTIQLDEPMNLTEMKAYVEGFEDARNAFFDAVDKFYRSNKTD